MLFKVSNRIYAQIVYDRNGDQFQQDARPSDAIALAIRFEAPIFVSEDVLDEAGIESESSEETVDSDIYQEPSDEVAEEAQGDMSKIDELKQDLEKAIEKEEYEKAAKLRDQIKKLKG
jgi:bifunctional DNase/RNase